MKKKSAIRFAAPCAAVLFSVFVAGRAHAAAYYWRGTEGNSVWDSGVSVNWASSDTGTSLKTYINETGDNTTQVYFDAGGSTDVTVDAGGVVSYFINLTGGNHTWNGGPVTADGIDANGGDLTINNDVILSESGDWFGYRPRPNPSTVTIAAGGNLTAIINPLSKSSPDHRLVVLTNGTLTARFHESNVRNNALTLYFDGGALVHTLQADRLLGETKLILGAGGIRIREYPDIPLNTLVPGPIGTDESLPTDGGVWIEEHTKYIALPLVDCTYRGGLHIDSSYSAVGVRTEGSLGAPPSSPTNNIFFLKSGATLAAHSYSPGNMLLHPNRNLFVASGVSARLRTGSASGFSMTVRGTVEFEDVDDGALSISQTNDSGYSDEGAVALCPSDNRTNRLGRLLVKAPVVIGSGTTLLASTKPPEGAQNEILDNASLNIADNGHLMVTGGVLRLMQGNRHVCQSARLTISGGIADFSASTNVYEFLHGCNGPAVTTIRDGGTMMVRTLRMAGNNLLYATNATKSVVNVETGGVLSVCGSVYILDRTGLGRKGSLNFNGGMLEWAHPSTGRHLENHANDDIAPTRKGLEINVLEGGMNVTNANTFYIGVPILSGAAKDGGFTKWGVGTFALVGTNTFNGPLTVMGGTVRLGGVNTLNTNIAIRVNNGATLNMNSHRQEIARLEGTGKVISDDRGDENLHVSSAVAPGMTADEPGTLTVSDDICTLADGVALEIDVDTEGNSDSFDYPAALDLSKMTLRVNDVSKLNGEHIYRIATIRGGIVNGSLFRSTNLPTGWEVRYSAGSNELTLVQVDGLVITFR